MRRSSITIRMVLLVVLVVGATTASIGTLAYTRARGALEEAARARLELLALGMARNLHGELVERVADITTWARLEAMLALTFADVDKELAEFMRHTVSGRRAYRALAGFDRTGRQVAAAGDAAAVPPELPAAPATRLRVVGAEPGEKELVLETPVFNPRDPAEPIGTLAAFLARGKLLDAMAAGRDGGTTPVEITVLAAPTGRILQSDPIAQDGAVLESTARLPDLPGVDAPPLTVVVREPASVALASILSLRETLVRVALLVLLLSGAIGAAVAWRISQPIRRLTAAVKQVTARGHPEPVVDLPQASGEVGILSAAFQNMLERLTAAQREAILQSRLALLGEVAASIAHDVRTPLSVLKTSAQLLAAGQVPATEQRDLARMMAAEVDRLNGVVSSLVDLARPRPVRVAPQPVGALVESATAVLRPWARSAGVAIDVRADPDALRVRADRDQMQQVLMNLMHNAVQAASKPGRVAVRWYPSPPWAVIEVEDTGVGFTPEALERAFSPFFTTKPEGMGLGLAIVKRLVEEQGGEVGLRNVAAGGACVWVRLPLVAEAA
jgi:signal transduction histidine kinase